MERLMEMSEIENRLQELEAEVIRLHEMLRKNAREYEKRLQQQMDKMLESRYYRGGEFSPPTSPAPKLGYYARESLVGTLGE